MLSTHCCHENVINTLNPASIWLVDFLCYGDSYELISRLVGATSNHVYLSKIHILLEWKIRCFSVLLCVHGSMRKWMIIFVKPESALTPSFRYERKAYIFSWARLHSCERAIASIMTSKGPQWNQMQTNVQHHIENFASWICTKKVQRQSGTPQNRGRCLSRLKINVWRGSWRLTWNICDFIGSPLQRMVAPILWLNTSKWQHSTHRKGHLMINTADSVRGFISWLPAARHRFNLARNNRFCPSLPPLQSVE